MNRIQDTATSKAYRHLSRDRHLGPLMRRLGKPPSQRPRSSFFHTLARAILYQQLAGAAATTIYRRFVALFPGRAFPSPSQVAELSDSDFRGVGISRQKAKYLRDLASKFRDGSIKPGRYRYLADEQVIDELTKVKGVGTWTAQMFLMSRLSRPDVLAVGDLGLQKGMRTLFDLEQLPSPDQMIQLAEPWRPYRSIASWYLWRLVDGV